MEKFCSKGKAAVTQKTSLEQHQETSFNRTQGITAFLNRNIFIILFLQIGLGKILPYYTFAAR